MNFLQAGCFGCDVLQNGFSGGELIETNIKPNWKNVDKTKGCRCSLV